MRCAAVARPPSASPPSTSPIRRGRCGRTGPGISSAGSPRGEAPGPHRPTRRWRASPWGIAMGRSRRSRRPPKCEGGGSFPSSASIRSSILCDPTPDSSTFWLASDSRPPRRGDRAVLPVLQDHRVAVAREGEDRPLQRLGLYEEVVGVEGRDDEDAYPFGRERGGKRGDDADLAEIERTLDLEAAPGALGLHAGGNAVFGADDRQLGGAPRDGRKARRPPAVGPRGDGVMGSQARHGVEAGEEREPEALHRARCRQRPRSRRSRSPHTHAEAGHETTAATAAWTHGIDRGWSARKAATNAAPPAAAAAAAGPHYPGAHEGPIGSPVTAPPTPRRSVQSTR